MRFFFFFLRCFNILCYASGFYVLLFFRQMFLTRARARLSVCVLFIGIVQRNWACLTWKSALEIKSLLYYYYYKNESTIITFVHKHNCVNSTHLNKPLKANLQTSSTHTHTHKFNTGFPLTGTKFLALWHSSKMRQPSNSDPPHQSISCWRRLLRWLLNLPATHYISSL